MDVKRQVALGAVFGAAVAVNAALQSLHDAGSFLIHSPSSSSKPIGMPCFPETRTRKRRALRSNSPTVEQTCVFRGYLEDENDEAGEGDDSEEQFLSPLSAVTPAIDTSADFADYLSGLGTNRLKSYRGQKLQVRRKNVLAGLDDVKAEYYLKGSEEANSSTEEGSVECENSSSSKTFRTTRRVQEPVFMPLLPQMIQSEEAMSAMLQQTTSTVLRTLSNVRERRERMFEEMRTVDLPDEQASLQLVNRFIDALINVSDSLKIVHSALF